MNLLSSLHKWAHRQDENFMTDAFVCLLQHLQAYEPAVAVKLLSDITERRIDLTAEECCDVEITTQVTTSSGRPDIEIRTSDTLAYIEVKAESGLEPTQLKRYRAALENSGYNDTFLCLLTRYAVESGAGGDHPDVSLRWLHIYEFLDKIENIDDVSTYVVNQFKGFLRDKGIVMEQVGWQLIDGVKAMQSLVNMIGQAIENKHVKCKPLTGGKEYIGYWGEKKEYWVGITYEDPACLLFEVNSKKQFNAKDLAKIGFTKEDTDGSYQVEYCVDLASEENHFFARDRLSQVKFIEDQVETFQVREKALRAMGY